MKYKFIVHLYNTTPNWTKMFTSKKFNAKNPSFKRHSTEGTIETTVTKNTIKDGTSTVQKVNIVETLSKMSTKAKIGLSIYAVFVTMGFCTSTYHDGRDGLMKRRLNRDTTKEPRYLDDTVRYEDDWKAVKSGCTSKPFLNFTDALFFPYIWVANVIPKVVMYYNPEKK